MIHSLHVGNFKAFGSNQSIPIRPITLLFGPNSSGKSSLIHSLALVHEANRTGNLDVVKPQIGGSSIDLGGFLQYIHRREASAKMQWGIQFRHDQFSEELRLLLKPIEFLRMDVTLGMPLDDQDRPIPNKKPVLMSYELSTDGALLLSMSRRPDGNMAVNRVETENPVMEAILERLSSENKMEIREIQSLLNHEIIPKLEHPPFQWIPHKLKNRRENVAHDANQKLRTSFLQSLNLLISGMAECVKKELGRFRYLGPLRSYPARHLAFSGDEDANWHAGGGYAWDVVRKNKEVREAVNQWLSNSDKLKTPYKLYVRELIAMDQIDFPLQDALEELENEVLEGEAQDTEERAKQLKKAMLQSDADRVTELILKDIRTHTDVSHRDVGIGISQVLPVLVSAYGETEKIIAIEQPEIHLHPALQTELGDVFIESALGTRKNTFILETHSEHLILRLLRRIRETSDGELPEGQTPLTPQDISVLYIQPGPQGSQVIPLSVTEDGDFEDHWPEGFFAERIEELM